MCALGVGAAPKPRKRLSVREEAMRRAEDKSAAPKKRTTAREKAMERAAVLSANASSANALASEEEQEEESERDEHEGLASGGKQGPLVLNQRAAVRKGKGPDEAELALAREQAERQQVSHTPAEATRMQRCCGLTGRGRNSASARRRRRSGGLSRSGSGRSAGP